MWHWFSINEMSGLCSIAATGHCRNSRLQLDKLLQRHLVNLLVQSDVHRLTWLAEATIEDRIRSRNPDRIRFAGRHQLDQALDRIRRRLTGENDGTAHVRA